jgi:hypothetical protein
MLLVDSEDRGRDLKDVQDLLKRLETVTEYMAGLEKRIAEHGAISKVWSGLQHLNSLAVRP